MIDTYELLFPWDPGNGRMKAPTSGALCGHLKWLRSHLIWSSFLTFGFIIIYYYSHFIISWWVLERERERERGNWMRSISWMLHFRTLISDTPERYSGPVTQHEIGPGFCTFFPIPIDWQLEVTKQEQADSHEKVQTIPRKVDHHFHHFWVPAGHKKSVRSMNELTSSLFCIMLFQVYANSSQRINGSCRWASSSKRCLTWDVTNETRRAKELFFQQNWDIPPRIVLMEERKRAAIWQVTWDADFLFTLNSLAGWLIDWLADWLTGWLADWLTYWLAKSYNNLMALESDQIALVVGCCFVCST